MLVQVPRVYLKVKEGYTLSPLDFLAWSNTKLPFPHRYIPQREIVHYRNRYKEGVRFCERDRNKTDTQLRLNMVVAEDWPPANNRPQLQ